MPFAHEAGVGQSRRPSSSSNVCDPRPMSSPGATTADRSDSFLSSSFATINLDEAAALATLGCPSSACSVSSDRQLGHGHQTSQHDPSDRVFPVRSVISVNPGMTSNEPEDFPRGFARSDGGSAPASVICAVLSPSTSASLNSRNLRGRRSISVKAEPGLSSPPLSGVISLAGKTRQHIHPKSGSISSVQADAERRGSMLPVPLNLEDPSDHESEITCDTSSLAGESSALKSPLESISESLYTYRFKHVMTDEGHAVITGRDGTLQKCEDEPIHAPGAIQAFGLMVAIREEPDGSFLVRYCSENSKRVIGYSPTDLFRMDNFLDILTQEQADNMLDHIDFIRDEEADSAIDGPEVFSISVRVPQKRTVKLWCAIHIHPAQLDLIMCEFELDDDRDYPLRPSDEIAPENPEDTMQSNPTAEELNESTEIISRPLRVLRSARKRRGEAGAMQVFDIMSQVQEQLATAPNLERLLKILVGIVKELTGFHRVMIYQFDDSFNGKVVTELVDPAQTRDLYKGLHFPASDIPRQARELYRLNKVRLLYDRDLESARVVCRTVDDLNKSLDMTHSYLRAMSPIHLKYLANMAVRSSMSISINAFNELWGLIACHSYGNKGMRVPFPIRKMCRLVGDTASRNIERLSYALRLQTRKLINTVPTDQNPSGYIIASSDDLLKLFDADFGTLSIRGETKILGKLEHSQEALAMVEYLRLRRFTSVRTTQDIKEDFPDLQYPPGFVYVAGLLYVPLSVGGHDFIAFFRKGQVREVKWAGNPYEKYVKDGTMGFLEPRKSFKTWCETVLGKCREWTEEQIETAAVLCLVYGKFIEVWRQKEAALQNNRLTRLLLANSAHEVRTPLNAIINYLEIALEGSLDQETRDNLARSHSASKSLIYVINDLLDLTKTEEGQELIKDEIFELPACVREATEPFLSDAKRKGIAYEFIQHKGVPRFVFGDQRRVRQALSNITANAVQHTDSGSVRIEIYVTEVQQRRVRIEIVVQDTGKGMSNKQLDNLFRDLEQVSTELDEEAFNNDEHQEKSKKLKTLGLGLAVVARFVRNMDGQLRLKSEEGRGSRFVIQIPFELPIDGTSVTIEGTEFSVTNSSLMCNTPSVSAMLPRAQTGERTLVDRGSGIASSTLTGAVPHRKSFDDSTSIKSHNSAASKGSMGSRTSHRSGMSDADRLIDAIQTPLTIGMAETENTVVRSQRSGDAYHSGLGNDVSGSARSASPHESTCRPDAPLRSTSALESSLIRSAPQAVRSCPGMAFVQDEKMPLKPIKIPDRYQDQPVMPQESALPPVRLELPTSPKLERRKESRSPKLKVLVAEDDPTNMKLLRVRLQKAGHEVFHTLNGQECASSYEENSKQFDVVLMDMQMPIVDGLTSTKMIRCLEMSDKYGGLSPIAAEHGHIPIFAVSASLLEREKDVYVDAGFDGWILKPIDFRRLQTLLKGIVDDGVRGETVYVPGEWERGGWFRRRFEL